MEEVKSATHHQVLIKLLDGKHKALNFTISSISIPSLKRQVETLTSIPSHLQVLLVNSRILHDHQSLSFDRPDTDCGTQNFPVVVDLLLRLRGGKGGFGSLLRGAATKAGQKKTNNFDACRDMSGRRLRHVNAEKRLEEWKAEAEERKLEKMAEEYIKKKAKELAKKGGKGKNSNDNAEKYVAKYREDSAKCMEEVERSVMEALKGGLKRKGKDNAAGEVSESDKKKMKIWLGKRALADSDSEDTDEDDSSDDNGNDEENEKSVVIDNGNHSDSGKEGSSGSVTDRKLGVASSDKESSDSGSEEEKESNASEGALESGSKTDRCAVEGADNGKDIVNHETNEERIVQNENSSYLGASVFSVCEAAPAAKQDTIKSGADMLEEALSQPPTISDSGEKASSPAEFTGSSCPAQGTEDETMHKSTENPDLEKPLNFEEYKSAAELEVLGMERLKAELQSRGLKCGGTLQERAARLFMLKTTPIDMLPKKLLAKK